MTGQSLPRQSERPTHGDVWRCAHGGERFSIMHVCGHHDPPCVTGYWWSAGGIDPARHGVVPIDRFLASFSLLEREAFDA